MEEIRRSVAGAARDFAIVPDRLDSFLLFFNAAADIAITAKYHRRRCNKPALAIVTHR